MLAGAAVDFFHRLWAAGETRSCNQSLALLERVPAVPFGRKTETDSFVPFRDTTPACFFQTSLWHVRRFSVRREEKKGIAEIISERPRTLEVDDTYVRNTTHTHTYAYMCVAHTTAVGCPLLRSRFF